MSAVLAAIICAANTWHPRETLTGSSLARYSTQAGLPVPRALEATGIQSPVGIGRIPLTADSIVPVYRAWALPAPVDQRPEQCVGYAWAAWAMSAPNPASPRVDGAELYAAAKKIDGMPPGSSGTYLPVGARVLRERGILASVRYTRSVNDVREEILTRGPAVLDTPWYTGMESPDRGTGYAHPAGSSGERYHAYVCYGYYSAGPDAGSFRCRNSQGDGWGLHGDFLITSPDLQVLFDEGGDAALAEKVVH